MKPYRLNKRSRQSSGMIHFAPTPAYGVQIALNVAAPVLRFGTILPTWME